MQEEFVTFETAQLLKKCDFPQVLEVGMRYYTPKQELIPADWVDYATDIFAPTQALALKWLREIHGIDIEAFWSLINNSKWSPYARWCCYKPK